MDAAMPSIREQKLRENRRAYETACTLFGGSPRVLRYYDQPNELSMDLLTVEDAPAPGLISYSTLGLLHAPAGRRQDGRPLRFELAGVCPREYEYFPELLCRCAFDIMNARFSCGHGSIYRDMVRAYLPGAPMEHILLVENPDFWGEPFPALELAEKRVRWLGVLPLWEQEAALLETEGPRLLLERLGNCRAWDWTRPPQAHPSVRTVRE